MRHSRSMRRGIGRIKRGIASYDFVGVCSLCIKCIQVDGIPYFLIIERISLLSLSASPQYSQLYSNDICSHAMLT